MAPSRMAPQHDRDGLPALTYTLGAQEYVYCQRCGLKTHKKDYVQQVHTVSAASLRMQRDVELQSTQSKQEPSLGKLLRDVDLQHQKTCDKDRGAPLYIHRRSSAAESLVG